MTWRSHNPSAIAAALSQPQRKLVLESAPDDLSGREGLGIDIRGHEYATAKALTAKGIGPSPTGSFGSDMYWNNELGLEVREFLRAQAGDAA
mgnify:CR=1 FL=1